MLHLLSLFSPDVAPFHLLSVFSPAFYCFHLISVFFTCRLPRRYNVVRWRCTGWRPLTLGGDWPLREKLTRLRRFRPPMPFSTNQETSSSTPLCWGSKYVCFPGVWGFCCSFWGFLGFNFLKFKYLLPTCPSYPPKYPKYPQKSQNSQKTPKSLLDTSP